MLDPVPVGAAVEGSPDVVQRYAFPAFVHASLSAKLWFVHATMPV
jgi:hypothetical protein